ncbi:MAG: restriction endonuclease subunit S [Oscillospiraceae bacterium]|nr:restriction endonuclease subunit S [Oscillospiraceae bacterium]
MMSEWYKCTIGEITSISAGGDKPKTYSNVKSIETPIPIFSNGLENNGLYGYTDKAKIEGDTITISARGVNIGTVCYRDNPFLPIVRLLSLVPNRKKVNARYLYYVLKNTSLTGTGSAQPQITVPMISKQEVCIHSDLETQMKIARLLFSFDYKIELNTAINENLEKQAQTIFKSWFVDFEPFGGVMPDDWKMGTFSDIIDSTLGGDWGKEEPTGNYTEQVYCIRGADIPEVKVGNKGKMPTRYILPKNFKSKKLVHDDIVIEISGGSPTQSTGRAAAVSQSLLDRYDKGMVCTNFCRAIKPIARYSKFIYYYWQYLYDRKVFFSYENGTTGIKNLDISGFIETEPIVIPPVGILDNFNKLSSIYFSKIFATGLENERLSNVRDTLLPKLMNGEIDVSKVQIQTNW